MTLLGFIKKMSIGIINFHSNLNKLGIRDDSDGSKEYWMKLFLAWMEWETDVHDLYWGDE
jgi:hypothetical protein